MALPVTVLTGFILHIVVECHRAFEGTSTVGTEQELLLNSNESFRLPQKILKRLYPALEMYCQCREFDSIQYIDRFKDNLYSVHEILKTFHQILNNNSVF